MPDRLSLEGLRREAVVSRCIVCGAELTGRRRAHSVCAKHNAHGALTKVEIARMKALREHLDEALPLSAFDLGAYSW